MRLFLLPKDFRGSPELELSGRDYNYIVNSLRLKEGQHLTGRDYKGAVWDLCIRSIGRKSVLLDASSSGAAHETTDLLPQDRPLCSIILYQCLPKGRKMDDIIKKATEIGVRAIVPVMSKNCVADLSGKEDSRTLRYEAVVKEAVQQSGSLVPTEVGRPVDISDVPSDFRERCSALNLAGRGIFLHQTKVSSDQSNLIDSVSGFDGCVAVLVGSEGGFTDSECSDLLSKGFSAVLLKTNILRCETASVYALAAVQTILESSSGY